MRHLGTRWLWFVIVIVAVTILGCQPAAPLLDSATPTANINPPTPEPPPSATPIAPPSETPTFAVPTATPLAVNKLGVHLLLDDGRNVWPEPLWPTHMEHARQAVGEWGYVTQLVRLDDLNPQRWQRFMDLCAELHLTPILRFATTFNREMGWWEAPPQDSDGGYGTVATQYAAFIAALEWPTGEHYLIVGNEPNHGNEWGGKPDPAGYARFLVDVSAALHEADTRALVLNAGFDPYSPNTGTTPAADGMYYLDEESFLDGMVAAHPDVFTSIDLWASHPYPQGPFTEAPWLQAYGVDWLGETANPPHIEPPPGIFNRGVNGYEWELWKLATYGVPPLPVMITETGWRHAETTDPTATDNGRPLPNAATVAQYLDLALHGNRGRYPALPEAGWTPWLSDPRVVAITPFALNGSPSEWGHTNWLALDGAGNVLGTYAPFELLATGRVPPP